MTLKGHCRPIERFWFFRSGAHSRLMWWFFRFLLQRVHAENMLKRIVYLKGKIPKNAIFSDFNDEQRDVTDAAMLKRRNISEKNGCEWLWVWMCIGAQRHSLPSDASRRLRKALCRRTTSIRIWISNWPWRGGRFCRHACWHAWQDLQIQSMADHF